MNNKITIKNNHAQLLLKAFIKPIIKPFPLRFSESALFHNHLLFSANLITCMRCSAEPELLFVCKLVLSQEYHRYITLSYFCLARRASVELAASAVCWIVMWLYFLLCYYQPGINFNHYYILISPFLLNK